MLNKYKNTYHYGEQNTEEWKRLKLGIFSSSTIHQLFSNPSKQSRAKASMKQIQSGFWKLCPEIVDNRPNDDQMTYASDYLVKFGFGIGRDFTEAKRGLKEAFKSKHFFYDTIDNYALTKAEILLMRACYAIDNVDILAGSAITLVKEKANELIHDKPKPDIEGVRALEHGKENEPLASRFFQDKTLMFCDSGDKKISFVRVEGLETGTSPDDTINGVIPSEYKCPENRNIHYDHCKIRNANDLFVFDKQKYLQLQHQMWVLKSDFGYWSSFHKGLLRNERTAHRAIHTIKIKLNYKIAKQFEPLIKQATVLRDKMINDFIKYNDRELWDF